MTDREKNIKEMNQLEGLLIANRTLWDVEYCKKHKINPLDMTGDTTSGIPKIVLDGSHFMFPDIKKQNIIRTEEQYQIFTLVNKTNGAVFYTYAPIRIDITDKQCMFIRKLTPEIIKEKLKSGEFAECLYKDAINDAIAKYGLDNFDVIVDPNVDRNEEDAQCAVENLISAAVNVHNWFCYNYSDLEAEELFFFDTNAKHAEWLTLDEGKKWLKEHNAEQRRKGGAKGGKVSKKNNTKQITIRCKLNNEVFSFDTYKDCMKYLCCSKPTFSAFLSGNSKYNKIYEIVS